ncbi:MAG: hypothetical protein V3U27_08735 [Candidatus Tectomicrobia bacterium]
MTPSLYLGQMEASTRLEELAQAVVQTDPVSVERRCPPDAGASDFDPDALTALVQWLRSECDKPPAAVTGRFSKRGVNAKAGQKWGFLHLDNDLALWIGKNLLDQTIILRPTTIRRLRGVQLLHVPPTMGEDVDATARLIREFTVSCGQLCRMDTIQAHPATRMARHPYFPRQPIYVAKYKALSTAHPFTLTYDKSLTIVAARTPPRGHPTPVHPVIPAPGQPPIAYVLGGSLQHPAINELTGIVLDVPVARNRNMSRIIAGETLEGRPRFHQVFRHTGPQRIAVELEKGMPIAVHTNPRPTDASTRQPLLVKRGWPDRVPQETMPSHITSRWLFMLPTFFTGQVVKQEGVVWVQQRRLFVGRRQAGLPAETIAISSAQAEQIGTAATFQVNVMDQTGALFRSYGFTWQGNRVPAWSPAELARIAQIQPVAQRRVLDRASWMPLFDEMLQRSWLPGDVADIILRVTDLGLGRDARVVAHVQGAIRAQRKPHEPEADFVSRSKREILEWLTQCGADRS